MHSDIAAQRHFKAHGPALDNRVATACAAKQPAQALHSLAKALRDEGMEQQALYDLFDSNRAIRTDDADEAAFDALCDEMDLVCGWHAADHPHKLFSSQLRDAQSKAREWQDVKYQVLVEAAEAAATSARPPAGSNKAGLRVHIGVAALGLLLLVAPVSILATLAAKFAPGTINPPHI
jgi:hypothetical protein